MRQIDVTEGEDFYLDKKDAERLRDAAERLKTLLRPRFTILKERAGIFQLTNVIGSIDLGNGASLNVTPKVATLEDWPTAVVSLLTGREGVDIGGERRAGASQVHRNLLDALAGSFLFRLSRAYRQEGPILLFERNERKLPYLQGRLNVTRWVQSALWQPHMFPVVRSEMAHDNPFTQGLVLVARTLARRCADQHVRQELQALARDLAPGLPGGESVPAGLASRRLPEQWSAYKPAWSLAQAILSKTSLFGPSGDRFGVSLAIEAWPLMETLLQRTLEVVQRVALRESGRALTYQMQGQVPLLLPNGGAPQEALSPKPDGRLLEMGSVLATFEAKYANYGGSKPEPSHAYQALSAAAACGARAAVLVYPGKFSPQIWKVAGFHGTPQHLVSMGLDLFKWLPPNEGEARGRSVYDVLRTVVPLSASHGMVTA